MAVLNGRQKYSTMLALVIFYASVSLASANDLGLKPDTNIQATHPGNEPARQPSGGLTSAYFTEYFNNIRLMITAPEYPDRHVSSMNESLEETATITLHKDCGKIIWSLAPSYGKLSHDQMAGTDNLQVVLKYRF